MDRFFSRFLIVSALILVSFSPGSSGSGIRKIPCKTPENSKACYWTHGRLTAGNGTPAVRLWKVGTKRLLGIYSGPSVDRYGLDNEDPELPANLLRKFRPTENWVFADFEVCPLEPEKPGAMQAACIESAKNIIVEK
jgi:hypothetical protein